MDEHEHLEDQINDLVSSFRLLACIQIQNDVVDPLKSQNFEDTQELKESCSTEIIVQGDG